jgi:uncharacterized ParB-like nuclease family protein
MELINLNEIDIVEVTQVREKICPKTVNEYAEAMKAGETFPPIELITNGFMFYIGDGHHRFEAAKKIGRESLEANVRDGSIRDAMLVAVSTNNKHGLRLTREDKRRGVKLLFEDDICRTWSDVAIAKQCNCSEELVAKIRKELNIENSRIKAVRNGKEFNINVPKRMKSAIIYPTEIGMIKEQHIDPISIELEELRDAMEMVREENIKLSDKLAIAALEIGEEEKVLAEKTIQELRNEVRQLHIQLESVIQSRDTYQSEKAEMHKQLNWYMNQRKKCTCKVKDKLEQAA